MTDSKKETFAQAARRIASEPAHIHVKAKPIDIDLTPTGVLARLQLAIDEARDAGDLEKEHLDQLADAVETLKCRLSCVDQHVLMRGRRTGDHTKK